MIADILPYASYHESRVGWRPLFFAKFFALVENAKTTGEAMAALVAPNHFTNWTSYPAATVGASRSREFYQLEWRSSTGPPVESPFDFLAYGYSRCAEGSGRTVVLRTHKLSQLHWVGDFHHLLGPRTVHTCSTNRVCRSSPTHAQC